ncbi:MAG TPA: OmpA family protein [Alphaproteobacteria bacterium]
MFQSAKILRTLVAVLALSIAAGCAKQASPPPTQAAAASGPELAGAWYQIYFDTNSTEINARGQTIIKTVAHVAANAGPTRVTVIGRTDRVGAPPDNMALAHRRANVVRDALITAGVPAAQIDTTWTGEGDQTVATSDDLAEPRNRVVDVTVVKQSP